MNSHTLSPLRKLIVGGAVFGASAGAGFVTISALDGEAPASERVVSANRAPSVSDRASVAPSQAPREATSPSASDVEFTPNIARDLEATKTVAGQVKVGDPCDSIDPALADVSLDKVSVDVLPMLPLVSGGADGSCAVAGWVYASPFNSPDLGEPDEDGFIAIPIYGDDGSVIDMMEAPAETRESVKEFDANARDQAGSGPAPSEAAP
jgi:hypothetical protein